MTENKAVVATYKSHVEAERAVNELQDETEIKDGKLVLIAHGTAQEAARAREIISRVTPDSLEDHYLSASRN